MKRYKLKKKGYLILKFIHIILACTWIGGAIAALFLLFSLSDENAPAFLTAFQVIDLGIIVPSNIGSLITGLLFSLITHWGFTKHRWIIIKYLINLVPAILGAVLFAPWLLRMLEISNRLGSEAVLRSEFYYLRNNFAILIIGQLLLLFVAVYLPLFKPSFTRKNPKRKKSLTTLNLQNIENPS